jgi:large subunit ribosomal protein L6
MSRVGKQIVKIPAKTEVNLSGVTLVVKGDKGELKRDFKTKIIAINITGDEITFEPKNEENATKALWGTYASHVKNMIKGVNEGFQKKLVIEGVGFKSEVTGSTIKLSLGFSHPVIIEIPTDLTVTAEKNVVTITGNDKESVGQFAAKIRDLKRPEPYKGKGIRYDGEYIRRKQGKKAV